MNSAQTEWSHQKGVEMPIPKSEKIWFNGKFVNWDDARIHVMSHVVNYGSSVFEGIRCYKTEKGSAVFCLRQHVQRLLNSAKIYRMEVPYSASDLSEAGKPVARGCRISHVGDGWEIWES